MTTSDFPAAAERNVITVSQLNRRARQLLETHLPLLWVEGELSNVSIPSSGHWYFTLKDDEAQVRCAMFRNRNVSVRFRPQHGQHVLIRARVSLYEGRGDYQIIVEHMEEAGAGALQRAYEQLKTRLASEGLFDAAHKKILPSLPRHIAVITSPTGAAIRDILSVLERRFPTIPVTLIPVPVQGRDAAPRIARALTLANAAGRFDVIILARGGGSLEDLWSFNEEIVARAIYASQIPVVSGVGHEIDFTIADFVADIRAPTPSAAAELVVPDAENMLDRFIGLEVLLEESMLRRLQQLTQRLNWLRQRLRHPRQRLEQQAQRLDTLEWRLKNYIRQILATHRHHLHRLALRQQSQHPALRLTRLHDRVSNLGERLIRGQTTLVERKKQSLHDTARLLNTLSPLKTLERGYALVTDAETGAVITRSQDLSPGSLVNARIAEGELSCRVEKISR